MLSGVPGSCFWGEGLLCLGLGSSDRSTWIQVSGRAVAWKPQELGSAGPYSAEWDQGPLLKSRVLLARLATGPQSPVRALDPWPQPQGAASEKRRCALYSCTSARSLQGDPVLSGPLP